MSHEEIVFNGTDFVTNVDQYVLFKEIADPTTLNARTALSTILGGTIQLNAFFSSFNTGNKPFYTWDAFLEEASSGNAALKTAITAAFVNSYRTILNMAAGSPTDPAGGEWTDFDALLPSGQKVNVGQEMIQSFQHFLETYPYLNDGTVGNSSNAADNFFGNWVKFMAVTANIKDSTDSVTRGTGTFDIAAYEHIYNSFGFPPGDFAARLKDFYLEKTDLSNPGASLYFIPSHYFDEWMEQLRQEYIARNFVSSVSTDSSSDLLVIDRILRLIISIIGVLQRISATQAERLNFLVDWQSAYTDQMNEVPQYARGDGSPLEGTSDDAKNARAEANARMQAILEKVRARRSVVQDAAKQLQSTINQSQDAANQQTQMATSLLQELSTILSQIYR